MAWQIVAAVAGSTTLRMRVVRRSPIETMANEAIRMLSMKCVVLLSTRKGFNMVLVIVRKYEKRGVFGVLLAT